MTKKRINTGITELDRDIEELFEAAEKNQLQELSRAVSSLPEQELVELLPDGILRLAFVLSSDRFDELRSEAEEESRPTLDRAKRLVEEHFPNLFQSAAAEKAIARLAVDSQKDLHPLADSMNVISSISPLYGWVGAPPALRPIVRIGFMNQKRRMLLDSSFDWDDLAYVLAALAKVLAGLMEAGKPLAEAKQLNLSDASRVAERLSQLEGSLDRVRKLYSLYGIATEATGKQGSGEEITTRTSVDAAD